MMLYSTNLRKSYIGAVFIFIVITASVAVVTKNIHYSWETWRPATCMPNNCFAERIIPGVVRQPINSWSSFAFVLAGFLVISEAGQLRTKMQGKKNSNQMVLHPEYTVWFGFTLILIGLGSAFYHASLTFVGQTIDVLGMYLLGTFLVFYNFARLFNSNVLPLIFSYILTNTGLIWLLVSMPQYRRYAFAFLILVTILLEYVIQRRTRSNKKINYFIGALAIFVLSFVIWSLDVNKIFFSPNSIIQGHALWHIGGAIAAMLIYYFYRSEMVEKV